MKTTVEISLYKLQEEKSKDNYKVIVKEFLNKLCYLEFESSCFWLSPSTFCLTLTYERCPRTT